VQPLEQLEAQMLGPQLTQALRSLPVADREALLLFAWAELSYQEIALALDVPLGTVRSRIHRARARVREQVVLNSQGETHA
jgi:RNA polymerase sigma-70 factor (ECF subfamily)